MPGDGERWSVPRQLERRYLLIRELGRGGMAVVYLGRERATGRLVAVKLVRGHHAEDADARSRFAREARTVAALAHPNIVRTFAVERFGDEAIALVMQYVPGGTLRDALRADTPLSYDRATAVLRDVARALRAAHARGIVHRDVKPENIFLEERTGRALLSDFGVALTSEGDTRLTMAGATIGTPSYMSPEQIDGMRVDARSDLYSLGLVGWEMLTGRRPWAGESLYRVMYKQQHEELPRLTTLRPDIPDALLFAIEGALAKHADMRWADADEFLAQLLEGDGAPDAAGATEPDEAPRPMAVARARTRRWRVSARAPLSAALTVALAAMLVVASTARRPTARRSAASVQPPLAGDSLVTDSAAAGSAASDSATGNATTGNAATSNAATGNAATSAPRDIARPGAIAAPVARSGAMRQGANLPTRCRSPALPDQRACLATLIALNDTALTRTYTALIQALRRESGAPARTDPPPVQALRREQRAWIAERDRLCAARLRGRTGARWAPPRARCLADISAQRTAELGARLRAITRRSGTSPAPRP